MIASEGSTLRDDIEEALKEVIDPEICINIVDLGPVYEIGWSEDQRELMIRMILTTLECPLQGMISAQIRLALESIVDNLSVEWAWLPPVVASEDHRGRRGNHACHRVQRLSHIPPSTGAD